MSPPQRQEAGDPASTQPSQPGPHDRSGGGPAGSADQEATAQNGTGLHQDHDRQDSGGCLTAQTAGASPRRSP